MGVGVGRGSQSRVVERRRTQGGTQGTGDGVADGNISLLGWGGL